MVRYGSPTKWQSLKGEQNWRAFDLRRLKNGTLELGLSVSWYERFPSPLDAQLDQVRQRRRAKYAKTGKLLELLVSTVRAVSNLEVFRDPLLPGTRWPDGTIGMVKSDTSHCLIKGLEVLDEQHRTAVANLLAQNVCREFPALTP